MTTQFIQQVPFTFLLRLASDNSYFVLLPREMGVNTDKSMSFYGYVSFADYNSILPHYFPPTPVDFAQFGAAWCEESLTAYLNAIGLNLYKKEFHYEGVMYQNNGNNLSAQGINNALLVGRLEINNQIETDFDNLFSNLITSLNTLLTPISQISLSLLGINNVFPTLVHNLEVLNENNVPVSIAQILKDKQIDVDMSQTEVSLDDTNLVSQLQNIYTILSSQNSNQAAISSAIQNKDNQSNIVSSLNNIFCYNNGYSCIKQVQLDNNSSTTETTKRYASLINCLNRLTLVFTKLKTSNIASDFENNDKLLTIISDLFSSGGNPIAQTGYNSIQSLSIFKSISDKLNSIETKLEQNLPFTTIVENDIVETNVVQNCAYGSKIEQIPFSE